MPGGRPWMEGGPRVGSSLVAAWAKAFRENTCPGSRAISPCLCVRRPHSRPHTCRRLAALFCLFHALPTFRDGAPLRRSAGSRESARRRRRKHGNERAITAKRMRALLRNSRRGRSPTSPEVPQSPGLMPHATAKRWRGGVPLWRRRRRAHVPQWWAPRPPPNRTPRSWRRGAVQPPPEVLALLAGPFAQTNLAGIAAVPRFRSCA